MNYVLAVCASFISVFVKGMQYKNINANMYKHAFFTSYAIAFLDVTIIGLVVKEDWTIALASGTGASIGMVGAMYLHTRMFKKDKTDDLRTRS